MVRRRAPHQGPFGGLLVAPGVIFCSRILARAKPKGASNKTAVAIYAHKAYSARAPPPPTHAHATQGPLRYKQKGRIKAPLPRRVSVWVAGTWPVVCGSQSAGSTTDRYAHTQHMWLPGCCLPALPAEHRRFVACFGQRHTRPPARPHPPVGVDVDVGNAPLQGAVLNTSTVNGQRRGRVGLGRAWARARMEGRR